MNPSHSLSYFPYKGFPTIPHFSHEEEVLTFIKTIQGSTRNSLSTLLAIGNQALLKDFSPELINILDKQISQLENQSTTNQARTFDQKKLETYLELGKDYQSRYHTTRSFLEKSYPEEDINHLVKLLAATSTNTKVKGNCSIFKTVRNALQQGDLDSSKWPLITTQLELIQEWKDLSWPKIHQYYKAIMGDENAVTVDTRIGRAFDIHRKWKNETGSLSPLDHLSIWYYIRSKSKEYWLTPAEMTVMIWRGIRIEQKQSLQDYPNFLP